MAQFPENFLWGSATSAYQIEGNNKNSDWWEWERRAALKEVSGLACRSYELYEQDFDLAKSLNHNTHRFSIEWSRVQPQENEFSSQEINHYINVVDSLRKRDIEPIVTLHHFTNPLWFANLGGWHNSCARKYFLRYTQEIAGALCDKVRFWVTINEPLVYVYHSYLLGCWPPQEKSFSKANKVIENLFFSHVEAYKLIHDIYRKKNLPSPFVSIAKGVQVFEPCLPTLRNRVASYLRDRRFNFEFLERLIKYKSIDFLGINYYTRGLAETQGWTMRNLFLDNCKKNHSRLKKNSLGWDIYPQGLYSLLTRFKKFNLPIYILENGICTEDDELRWNFIYEHLKAAQLAINEGVNVSGYIYWSLLDNYEWDKGFEPRFGLVEVDYNTYKRTVRESAKKFSVVCGTNQLD